MTPYPTQLDAEALPMILGVLKGTVPDPKTAVHVVYDVIGFGLGKLYNDGTMTATDCPCLSKEDVTKQVEKAVVDEAAIAAIDWKSLIAMLLQVLPFILPFLKPTPAPTV